jgi:hypothetical protein
MRKTTKINTGGSRRRFVKGTITTTTGGNHNMYSNGSIITNARGEIIETAEEGHFYGDYVPPEEIYITHPTVVKVEFFDENNKLLNQNTKDFFYGKKLKIKVTTKDAKDWTLIFVRLQAKTKSKNQPFDLMRPNKNYNWWGKTVVNNTFETPLFELNPNWYSDDFENYDYNSHITKIDENDLNEFYTEVKFDSKTVYFPLAGERLRPVAYKRNYEELIGLFNIDNSGSKDLLDNYENKFIDSVKDFKKIVDSFSEYLCEDNRDLTIAQIETEILKCAKELWSEAVWQNQGHELKTKTKDPKTRKEKIVITQVPAVLDDRPLYWSRIAMQVILKRHPAFYDDIKTLGQNDQDDFFIKSIVPKNSKLWKTMQLFEEQSRNYTNIDFSKAGYKKKVLITGFDPFLLNSIKYPKQYNILQSNPSGVVALALANNNQLGGCIQTMIVPVRYSDFDNSKEYDKGQGDGIIEKYIKPFINEVDMIITVSQYLPKENVIDKFGTVTRGGSDDNLDFTRINGSVALVTSHEWIETTLPKEFTNAPNVVLNWKFNGVDNPGHIAPKVGMKLTRGSGGAYLSNEIFYRVAKLRVENPDKNGNKGKLATGHFHIEKLQDESIGEDLPSQRMKNLLENIVKNAIEEGIKAL